MSAPTRYVPAYRSNTFGSKATCLCSTPERQGVPEEPHAEVRIFEARTDIASELVTGEEIVELLDGIIGIRICLVFRRHVGRQSRQPRTVGREIGQRDL